MNNDIIIDVHKVTKRYLIGARKNKTESGSGSLASKLATPFNYLRHSLRPTEHEIYWALKGVDMQIHRGEVVGIMGPNGAGKTTLLKLLSRVTTPTTGFAIIKGRIGSLLGAGAGFHPELTGRENVYINGAILGMRKEDIDACFEDILEFSEIQDFIDTPVKRYSSGMFARLGFSVAAHLKTDILIIDEILATGDRGFRQKSLAKMAELAKAGRTVIIVAHNINHLTAVCERGYVLDKGRMVYNDEIDEAVEFYNDRYIKARYGKYKNNRKKKSARQIKSKSPSNSICKNQDKETAQSLSAKEGTNEVDGDSPSIVTPEKDDLQPKATITKKKAKENQVKVDQKPDIDLGSSKKIIDSKTLKAPTRAYSSVKQYSANIEGDFQISPPAIIDKDSKPRTSFYNHEDAYYEIVVRINTVDCGENIAISCRDEGESAIFTFLFKSAQDDRWPQKPGEYIFRLEIPVHLLKPGNYHIVSKFKSQKIKPTKILFATEPTPFEIIDGKFTPIDYCDAGVRTPIQVENNVLTTEGIGQGKIVTGYALAGNNEPTTSINYFSNIDLSIIVVLADLGKNYRLCVRLLNSEAETIMRSEAQYLESGPAGETGCSEIKVRFPGSTAKPGIYNVRVRLYDYSGKRIDMHNSLFSLNISNPNNETNNKIIFAPNSLVAPQFKCMFKESIKA